MARRFATRIGAIRANRFVKIASQKNPDPPILAFFVFLAFFCFPISLAFLCGFPLFSKDFRGSAKRKNPCFFRGFLAFFEKARVGGSGNWAGLIPDLRAYSR